MKQTAIAFLSVSILLSSCAPAVPAQSLFEITETPGSERAILPTPIPTENTRQKLESTVAAHLAGDPDAGRTYVQYAHGLDETLLIQRGVDFLEEIGDGGQRLVTDGDVSIGVNAYGILYAEALDGTVLVFNIKDQSDNYLIATKEEAFRRLATANPAAIEGKTIDDFLLSADAIQGVLASLLDSDGQAVMGVNTLSRQWQAINTNGILVGDPGKVPTAPVEAETPAEALLASKQEVITNMVKDFAASKIEFPADLTREQYSAFIKEMNVKYSNKPIYVEAVDKNGNKIVYYHNVANNKMETLPGSYAENKEKVDQNYYSTFIEIAEEEGTGNLQYVHPDTGELMTVPNSTNVDWTKIIDDKNMYDGYITWPTTEKFIQNGANSQEALTVAEHHVVGFKSVGKYNFIKVILLNKESTQLTAEQGAYYKNNCLDMMFIRVNKNGQPLYGVSAFVGAQGEINLTTEGESVIEKLHRTSMKGEQLESNRIYFVALSPNQEFLWTNMNFARIDQLENTTSATEAYKAATSDFIPKDGNIILTSSVIVKKK